MYTMKANRLILSVWLLCGCLCMAKAAVGGEEGKTSATISLKIPGNAAQDYPLTFHEWQAGHGIGVAKTDLPVMVSRRVTETGQGERITVTLTAEEDLYFNYGEQVKTGYRHDDCQFYMPGFWYRRNLRSPQEAPSFHTSDSWLVRDDRLSTPMTAAFDERNSRVMSVMRVDDFCHDALTTHEEGEVIVSGRTSIGYTGFQNQDGETVLAYGFPYREEPRTYIRKLTLAPAVKAFQHLRKGESITLCWDVAQTQASSFSECVQRLWEYGYDTYRPQPVETSYTPDYMKEVLSHYFLNAYVKTPSLNYYASPEMRVATCDSPEKAEVGFVGRVLLNAFNAWEYGWQVNRQDLKENSQHIFDSYLKNGFTSTGFFREYVDFEKQVDEQNLSIRRQSEGIYAMLHFLHYEREAGRVHPEWENRIRKMLDLFLRLQNEDGSFPRKFHEDLSIVDKSGGSTSSATLPLVMGYKYYGDKRYLEAAMRTADYMEQNIILKSDYFSSTLDANCEDKEASLYASVANYYLALVTRGEKSEHYARLCRDAAYFALSWYYLWDVPFAKGQMLGDLGLQTRGWGNVSVENNHIDVFIFGFADVLTWLSKRFDEPRFFSMANVISTSMRQLLPFEGHLCGVAKPGYYPEVIQHTYWDYGRNGKGFYNDIFAPGWTVASLWELYSPGRAERFFHK